MSSSIRHRQRAERGFTLIETLVALFVLTIAIVGPLGLASTTLKGGRGTEARLQAFFLAQEGIEFVKNVRASAEPPFGDSDDWLGELTGAQGCVNQWCDIDPKEATANAAMNYCGSDFQSCQCLDGDTSGYDLVNCSANPTGLKRGVYITSDSGAVGPHEALVEVRVEYEVDDVTRTYTLWHLMTDVEGARALADTSRIPICGDAICAVGEATHCPVDCGAGGFGANFDATLSPSDTIPDASDNCWCYGNQTQNDGDADGVGDVCDYDAYGSGFFECCSPSCGQ